LEKLCYNVNVRQIERIFPQDIFSTTPKALHLPPPRAANGDKCSQSVHHAKYNSIVFITAVCLLKKGFDYEKK